MILSLLRPTELPRTRIAKPRMPGDCRAYVIGDIHGCLNLLDDLHEKIRQDLKNPRPAKVVVIYLGDYIDRGPHSAGVLERLTQRSIPNTDVILLKGNHEEMLERFLDAPQSGIFWRQLGGAETLQSYRIDVRGAVAGDGLANVHSEFLKKFPASHLALLKSMRLSVSLGDYFFCHAGPRPGIPLEHQSADDLLWIRQPFLASAHAFEKIIVHGHSPVEAPEFHSNRINIDTGAYATGRLTCLVLEGQSQRLLSTGFGSS